MSITSKIVGAFYYNRNKAIDLFRIDPLSTSHNQFTHLMSILADTQYGIEHGIESNITPYQFSQKIPIVTYEDIATKIENTIEGAEYPFWNKTPLWYAKSSGTTNSASKYIPTTKEALKKMHYRGLSDVAAIYTTLYPNGKAFDGKTLTLGGSLVKNNLGNALIGDLSGILMTNFPAISNLKRAPSNDISLMSNFEEKIALITKLSPHGNITCFAGVPSWYMVLMNSILEYTGKSNLCEVWPNIDFFAHGGMSFTPYREQYNKLFPSPNMKYMETYNASEGFFAIQDDPARDDMLLMLDYNIYYEFLESSLLDHPEKAITLEDVKCDVNYALIISTSGGLWRYMIGDTVKFTSTSPYRIQITGRTKHFINIAGEEIIIDNTDKAIKRAVQATGATISEYTVAPIYMSGNKRGAHEWILEFDCLPSSLEKFALILDNTLQEINSDYSTKRSNNGALDKPLIHIAKRGTFYSWMKQRGKLGGQNKIPRLSNTREYVDSILGLMKIENSTT